MSISYLNIYIFCGSKLLSGSFLQVAAQIIATEKLKWKTSAQRGFK